MYYILGRLSCPAYKLQDEVSHRIRKYAELAYSLATKVVHKKKIEKYTNWGAHTSVYGTVHLHADHLLQCKKNLLNVTQTVLCTKTVAQTLESSAGTWHLSSQLLSGRLNYVALSG